ncbi:MAG: ABC-F family ATP-binding cassette domain-containing protein [Planctomycetota bacterium]|nr:ABC-F family ATP-binding cassette domain-containing protein [Planctomycetota bacterium]
MLQIQSIRKAFGQQILFDDAGCLIEPGEKVGLVGANGHGKSTLLKMILQELEPDEGLITVHRGVRIGHLSQHLVFSEKSTLEEACLALPLQEEGFIETYRAEAMLMGLGFTRDQLDQPPEELSGGFQVRLNLAKSLLEDPDLLLLDEPNNYLDIVSLRWLKGFLRKWQRTLLLVTHDREFMDSVTTHTLAVHRQKLRKFTGTTEKAWDQIYLEEEMHEKTRVNSERKIAHEMRFVERFRAKARRASQAQSRLKQIAKRERLDKLDEISTLSFSFNHIPNPGKWSIETRKLDFNYQGGPTLISGLELHVGARDRVGIIGPNGKGKSTLLRILARELKPVQGEVRSHPSTKQNLFGQSAMRVLQDSRSIEEEINHANSMLNRTQVRDICGAMMFGGDLALKKVEILSGGERARTLLGRVLATPANLLLLDEPTNHLDMASTEALIEAVNVFQGAVLMVTHVESVLRETCNRLVIFDAGKVRVFEGGYDDFLRRYGWSGEQDQEVTKPRKKSENRKIQRQERAQLIEERSRLLKPLKDTIQSSESLVMKVEEQLQKTEALLIEASEAGDAEEISRLSLKLKNQRDSIDKAFKNLESASEEHDRIQQEYDERLSDGEADE